MKILIPLTATLFAASQAFSASVITVNNGTPANTTAASSISFPTGTDTDWAYYSQAGTPSSPSSSFVATNTSGTGTRVFTVTTLGGGNVRGPGDVGSGSAEAFFDFSAGTSPTIGTDIRPTGVFNSQLGSAGVTAGAGMSLSMTGFTGPSVVQLWTFGFNSTGLLTVLVNGVANAQTFSVVSTAVTNGKPTTLFTLNVTPDNTTDTVEVRYVATASTDAFSHVGFQAVAISPVPEPTSLALLGLAGAAFGFRRRR